MASAQATAGDLGHLSLPGPTAPAPVRDLDVIEAEEVTLQRAKSGDHDAFRVVVERYQGRAYRLALRILRDEDEAKDAVQDSLVRAYTALPRFEGRSSFYTWFYRLVMNQCLDRKRREKSARLVKWDDGDPVEAAAAALPCPEAAGVWFCPDAALRRKELRAAIGEALEALSDKAVGILMLREVDGLSYAEIAAVQGVPVGTVMSRLYTARQSLRAALRASDAIER